MVSRRIVINLFLFAAVVLCLTIALSLLTTTPYLPAFQEVKESHRASDAVLLDRHGEVIQEMRVDSKGRRLNWTGIREISPSMLTAVMVVEDRRFYNHHGVDWAAVISSALGNLRSGGTQRGASTITMQLVPIIGEGLAPGKGRRSWLEKLRQMRASHELEQRWTKDQILEAYLNLISFRGELQGISAAAQGIFGKDPSGLSDAESLILACLITSPNAPPEEVIRRASLFSRRMER
ncbi:MAG: transglycosylase domain-containing protein, partial [Nitrospirales bacterium]|nr:transglycosylase domain-containing protein [Nitrospirales bacterium]